MAEYDGYPILDTEGATVETEKLVHERLIVNRPMQQDAIYIYKLRYWQREDGSHRQEYGGFPDWHPYSGMDVLDMSASGAIVLDGLTLTLARARLQEMEEEELRVLRSARDEINKVLDACGPD